MDNPFKLSHVVNLGQLDFNDDTYSDKFIEFAKHRDGGRRLPELSKFIESLDKSGDSSQADWKKVKVTKNLISSIRDFHNNNT